MLPSSLLWITGRAKHWSCCHLDSETTHQFGQAHSEGLGDEVDVPQRQISFPSFDPAHVGPIQTTLGSERFLRQTFCPSQVTDSLSEAFEDVNCFAHAEQIEQQPSFGPRAMSITRGCAKVRFLAT